MRIAARPANATSEGTTTELFAETLDIGFTVAQPGDPGDPTFSWSQNIDGDDALERCVDVEDDETGHTFVTCSGFDTQCEDGERFASTLFIATGPDGAFTIAGAAGDWCGSGARLFGCQYSRTGSEGSCGPCAQALGLAAFVCSPQVELECVNDFDCGLLDHCNLGLCLSVLDE